MPPVPVKFFTVTLTSYPHPSPTLMPVDAPRATTPSTVKSRRYPVVCCPGWPNCAPYPEVRW